MRRRRGRGFSYVGPDGRVVRGPARERITRLRVPPAWTDVWIAPDPCAHLQATGRDARGRKQYLYHPRWRALRDATKYQRLTDFAASLPRLRASIDADMRRHGLPRERVLATAVRLLQAGHLRVGSEAYRRVNGSYGLTTLRDRHVDVSAGRIHVEFRGKGGRPHLVDLHDRRLARALAACQELPGQELFQYVDDDGARHRVASHDINDYLREAMGQPFTAKDFRTWSGTVLAAVAIGELGADDAPPTRVRVNEVVARVAARLGNTRAVCRKCYIHPDILDGWSDPALRRDLQRAARAGPGRETGLSPEERAVLRFLERRGRATSRRRRPSAPLRAAAR